MMPNVLIELRNQFSKEKEIAMMKAVYDSLTLIFKVSTESITIRLQIHEPHRFICPPNLTEPQFYTLITIDCLAGRTLDTKRKLYQEIVKKIEILGIPKNHIKIIIRELQKENCGVRGGQTLCDIDLGFEINI